MLLDVEQRLVSISSTSISAIVWSSSIISFVLSAHQRCLATLISQVLDHDEGMRGRRNFVTRGEEIDGLDSLTGNIPVEMHSEIRQGVSNS